MIIARGFIYRTTLTRGFGSIGGFIKIAAIRIIEFIQQNIRCEDSI